MLLKHHALAWLQELVQQPGGSPSWNDVLGGPQKHLSISQILQGPTGPTYIHNHPGIQYPCKHHWRPSPPSQRHHFEALLNFPRQVNDPGEVAGVHEFGGPFPSALQTCITSFYHQYIHFKVLRIWLGKLWKKIWNVIDCTQIHPICQIWKKSPKASGVERLGPVPDQPKGWLALLPWQVYPPTSLPGVYKGEKIRGQANHQCLNQPILLLGVLLV